MSTTATKDKNKLADLVGPTDPDLDREVREILVGARIGMLLRASFFGNLATRLKLVNADEWCPTAATDGRHFYYNTRFIKMLKPREVEFLFGHEVLHVVYDHLERTGDRDRMLSNIAQDYCVNSDLKKHGVGEFITTVECLYDSKYEDWSFEQVYDDLLENADESATQKMLDKVLDEHLEDILDGAGSGQDTNDEGKPGPVKLTDEERQQIKDEIKEAMISAAQTAKASDIPGNVQRMIQNLTEPKMNWRDLLQQQLQSTIKNDYTFSRTSRRSWHMDAILPGMDTTDAIDIAVAIDMSGSISEEQGRDFLSEVQGIMDTFTDYRIHLFTFDTQVYNPQDFNSDNISDITEYQCQGWGGTSFECIFDYLKEADIEPKKLVTFTDGYPFGSWGDPDYCDTVWIIHSNDDPNPPFGTWAKYESQ